MKARCSDCSAPLGGLQAGFGLGDEVGSAHASARRESSKHMRERVLLSILTLHWLIDALPKKKKKRKALHFYPPWHQARSIQLKTSHVICIHRCWSSLISGKNPYAFFRGVWEEGGSDGLFRLYSITIWRQVIWLCREQRFQDANLGIGFPMIIP